MKEFKNEFGRKIGKTMTVSELIDELNAYPKDMPVFAEWEGVNAFILPENFGVKSECLVIDVNYY